MKRIFILSAAALLLCAGLTSCGTKKAEEAAPSPSASAEAAAPASALPTAAETYDGGNAEKEDTNVPSNNETTSEEISIINGTSIEFFDLYISENATGNLGENIINGESFGEGEEIVLPYANLDSSKQLKLIAADAEGRRYVLDNLPISNGAVIELRLNGSSLEAVVQ